MVQFSTHVRILGNDGLNPGLVKGLRKNNSEGSRHPD
jgi:hypothetical protein